jgi:microcystin-dependent protein
MWALKAELKAVRDFFTNEIKKINLKIYGRDPDGLITLDQIAPEAVTQLRQTGDFYRKGERLPASAIPSEIATDAELLSATSGTGLNASVRATTIINEVTAAREGEASLKDNLANYLLIDDVITEINASVDEIDLARIADSETLVTDSNVIESINDSVEVEQIEASRVNLTSVYPIGITALWSFAVAPTGWFILNGQEISKATYAALYALVGDGEGVPVDPNNFVLPNWQGYMPIGLKSTDTDFDTLGETGGAKSVTLQQANLPNVNFAGTTSSVWQTDPLCTTPIKWDTTTTPPDGCLPLDTSATTSSASGGTDTPFSIMNPYKVIHFIIKAL